MTTDSAVPAPASAPAPAPPGPATRFLTRLAVELDPPQMTGTTPAGVRKIVPVRGGTFEGPRLSGTVLAGGGHDWALIRSDGSLRLDVRLTLRTHDQATLLLTYQGFRHGPPEVLARLAAGEQVDPAEYYFRIAAFFETDAPAYSWLNALVTVGTGSRPPAGPQYDLFEVL